MEPGLIDEAMVDLLLRIQDDLERAISAEEQNDPVSARSAIDEARDRIRATLMPMDAAGGGSNSQD